MTSRHRPAGVHPRDWRAWVDANPLRRWRKESGWTIAATCEELGVGTSLLQLWEQGVHVPNDPHMEAVGRLIGAEAPRRWTNWLSAVPLPRPREEEGVGPS